jgi:transglutaminase-like putative cysteine protease
MRDAVRAGIRDPQMRVRNQALAIVKGVRGHDFRGEVEAIWDWVRENIRFVRDIRGIETIATPARTLDIGQGDCDDMSVLISALLESLSHPTRFVAVGFRPGELSHVFTETRIGNRWVPLETSIDGSYIGWYPPGIRESMVQKI